MNTDFTNRLIAPPVDSDGVKPSHRSSRGDSSSDSTSPVPGLTTDTDGGGPPPPLIATAATPDPNDPFNPATLRLGQDFGVTLGVKKALLTVPVRKPSKEWFVQVHPDEGYRLQTAVVELKEDRETYLVAADLWPELATDSTFGPRAIFTTINKQGVVFLWPIRLPGPDGKLDEWNTSALEAAEMAQGGWVRVQANMSLGAYEVFTSADERPPTWPDVPFNELLRTAFKGHYIDTLDHPVLRRLRGEA